MNLRTKLQEVQDTGKAVLAFNFYNMETLQGILLAASELNQPIILQVSPSSVNYMGIDVLIGLAKSASKQYGVETWLHLDHCDSVEMIINCLESGFDSIMIDASEKSFSENVGLTSKVVALAKKFGVNVEAELGYIPKLGQKQNKHGFTDPNKAKEFVELTKVYSLAVSIGTVHGFYTSEPKLDIQRLEEIRALVNVPLVLHGGSGIEISALRDSIQAGICKINIATEIKNIFTKSIKNEILNNNDIDLRNIFPPAIVSVKNLVKDKIQGLL